MEVKSKILTLLRDYSHILALAVCISVATGITFVLYSFTRDLLLHRLNERLMAIASTSSILFDADEIEFLKEKKLDAVKSDIYRKNVLKLQAIRNANSDIRYAYILSQTEDPNTVNFVVDADAASVVPVIDFNEDGVVDDEDVSIPGEIYDASEVPALQGPAFAGTIVDEQLSVDEWGTFLSGYSPIFDDAGQAVATLTIDVEVTDFLRIVGATFLPFLLFILLLLLLITGLTLLIVKVWKGKVDAVKELDNQKDELLGLVSHQLATPVSSIKWYLEMLEDGDLGELNTAQKEHIRSMRAIGVNMSDLVSMILDVSRIQLGRMKIERQDLELNGFFHEILATIEPKAVEKKLEFIKYIPDNLPMAKLDRRYTNMTIENLLSNAVKYTPTGGRVICEVKIENDEVFVTVSDTGIGIPKAEQGKIFGRMYRASNTRNAIDGNGFGLFVAKGAVEAQGGNIWFESEENGGTKFYVRLPLR